MANVRCVAKGNDRILLFISNKNGTYSIKIGKNRTRGDVYAFYGISLETADEFERRLKYEIKYGGQGFKALRWLERVGGKGKKGMERV